MQMRTTRLRDAIVWTLFAGSASFAFAANAQTQDATQSTKTLEKVVVTGSSIPRTDLETASPVQVITAKDLQSSGLPTVIQNSGSNVLIQNATIVNVQFQ